MFPWYSISYTVDTKDHTSLVVVVWGLGFPTIITVKQVGCLNGGIDHPVRQTPGLFERVCHSIGVGIWA